MSPLAPPRTGGAADGRCRPTRRLRAGLLADGLHVHPAALRLAYAARARTASRSSPTPCGGGHARRRLRARGRRVTSRTARRGWTTGRSPARRCDGRGRAPRRRVPRDRPRGAIPMATRTPARRSASTGSAGSRPAPRPISSCSAPTAWWRRRWWPARRCTRDGRDRAPRPARADRLRQPRARRPRRGRGGGRRAADRRAGRPGPGGDHRRGAAGPPEVVAVLPGAEGAPRLLLEAHMDTVPQPDPPLEVGVDGDRLTGRGACDTKGSCAAMLAAVARLAREDLPHATVVFAAVVDEESGMAGSARSPAPGPPSTTRSSASRHRCGRSAPTTAWSASRSSRTARRRTPRRHTSGSTPSRRRRARSRPSTQR